MSAMSQDDPVGWLDIGSGHKVKFYSWSPDRELNPQYADMPDIDRCGLLDEHVSVSGWDAGERHCGSVMFELPEVRTVPALVDGALWQVQSFDPLTISPSLLCGCGDHGFIRDGLWVPA